jgi:cytochrome P450
VAVPRLSVLDDLAYNLMLTLPNYLQGTFTRSRFWVSVFSRLHPDPLAVRLVGRLRRKYRSDYLSLHLLADRALLVLDPAGIQSILERSPARFAEPRPKRQGMSHFQPGAVTISRGAQWTERRRFNAGVLESRQRVHSLAERFLDIIVEEVDAVRVRERLEWKGFERLFERLALGLLFGRSARSATGLTRRLSKMMREGNRLFALRRSRHFDPYYAELRSHLARAEEGSLAALCRRVPSTPDTRVESQLTHWLFALKDTLALNTVAALALIATHPHAEARVREELGNGASWSAEGLDGARYLEGCVQEGMRLWPTTPALVREAVADDSVCGRPVAAGTQVVILNGFNHRDRSAHDFADRFTPEHWLEGRGDFHFNHLSNGPQDCAGRYLALFVAKAVIARLLRGQRYSLERPSLDPGQPLPHAFNAFRARFVRGAA